MLSIIRATGTHDDFKQLTQLLDADLNARYGTLQAMYDRYNVIESIETVVIAYLDQLPVGCGGIKRYDPATVELKRMYVRPEHRGKGVAVRLLAELETWACELGFSAVILETGRKQAEAIGLYTKHGYRQIENYGQYQGVANSVCFRKVLV